MKILIVDDNNEILEILTLILEQDGHSTKEINNGDELFTAVESYQPDLILLDIMLGKHDGRKLCADLKADKTTNHIPIIMISASHAQQSLKEMDCKPNGFIPKPFDIDHVSEIVNTFS